MKVPQLSGLTLRQRVMAATGLVVFCAAVLLTAGAHYLIDSAFDRDANRVLRDRTDAALSTLSVKNGAVDVENPQAESPLDENVWIYAGGHNLRSGRGVPAVQQKAAELATVTTPTDVILPDQNSELRAVPFISDGRQYGTVVAALSLEVYTRSERIATLTLAVAGMIIVVGSVFLAAILVKVALRPIAVMTSQAAAWSDSDLDNRFRTGTVKDEIGALAVTLNGLLDRLSASIHHEQRFTSEIAHELRTPLTALLSETAIAMKHAGTLEESQAALTAIDDEALRMGRIIDTLMAMAERDADPRAASCDLSTALFEASAAWVPQAERAGRRLEIDPGPEPVQVGVDASFLVRIVSPVVDNAIKYARSTVNISINRGQNNVEVRVADDGDGVAAAQLEPIFEPGYRDPSESTGRGAGLGLPLARRLARSAGGDVTGLPGGPPSVFVVRIPLA